MLRSFDDTRMGFSLSSPQRKQTMHKTPPDIADVLKGMPPQMAALMKSANPAPVFGMNSPFEIVAVQAAVHWAQHNAAMHSNAQAFGREVMRAYLAAHAELAGSAAQQQTKPSARSFAQTQA